LKEHWILFISLALFIVIHAINYYFYKFIPEFDSYMYLKEVSISVNTGMIASTYRGFFHTAATITSAFAHITPYNTFVYILVPLTATFTVSVYALVNRLGIRDKGLQLILTLSTLAFPIINMDIDIVRPQNMLIIGLPLFLYFMYVAIQEKNKQFFVLASLIAILGLNYHEFFLILFFAYLILVITLLYRKLYFQSKDPRDRIIFGLSLLSIVLVIYSLLSNLTMLSGFSSLLSSIKDHIFDVSRWKWWFLSNYSDSNGLNYTMSWTGIGGVSKYYGYHLAPYGMIIAILLLTVAFRKKLRDLNYNMYITVLPAFFLFFMIAEVLPRLNFIILPERAWPFIDISLIFMGISYFLVTNKYHKLLSYLLWIALIVGVGGSFYVASGKKSATSPEDYTAANWISTNTPTNSIFLSQPANGPMIQYFADRKLIVPNSDTLNNLYAGRSLSSVNDPKIETWLKQLNSAATSTFYKIMNDFDITDTDRDKLSRTLDEINSIQNTILVHQIPPNTNVYFVYTTHVFDGFRKDIPSWRDANFYNLNTNQIAKHYQAVYDSDGVYIWKIY